MDGLKIKVKTSDGDEGLYDTLDSVELVVDPNLESTETA